MSKIKNYGYEILWGIYCLTMLGTAILIMGV